MLEIKIDDSDLKAGINAVMNEVPAEMIDSLDHAKRKFLKTWRAERLAGPPGVMARPSRGGGIFVRFQAEKIRSGSPDTGNVIGITIGTDSKTAKLQEEGGTVRGEGKGLAVPLQVRTKMFLAPITGALKKSYADIAAIKNLVPIKFSGKTFLTKVSPRDHEKVEPMFVIKEKVELKPRLGFVGTFEKMEPILYSIIAKRLLTATQKAWGGGTA